MDSIDLTLREISTKFAGVFTTEQAALAGIPRGALHRRVRRGVIRRLHHGVYFYGQVVTREARRWAAILAGPDDALLSGEAAEHAWGIARFPTDTVEILTATRHRRIAGVRSRQSTTIHPEDVATCHGRPTVSVERLLVELARLRTVGQLCWSLRQARFWNVLDITRLERTIARNPRATGIDKLRQALELHLHGDGGSDSEHEERFGRMLERAGITGFRRNVTFVIEGTVMRVDFYVEHLDLIIEIDPEHHAEPPMRREDQLRTSLFRLDGHRHLRVVPNRMRDGVRAVVRMDREYRRNHGACRDST